MPTTPPSQGGSQPSPTWIELGGMLALTHTNQNTIHTHHNYNLPAGVRSLGRKLAP